ncbi:unnamed protein product, partial [Didymodactylos carnosus]
MAGFFSRLTASASTPLQQAIEKVTDPSNLNEDWDLIMQICDNVVENEDNAKEAIKVIRKRLQAGTAGGWRGILLTLTLLEALSKNCGKIFHLQIASKDFLKELKNVIGPKNNPPVIVQEKVLGMVQTWAIAMRNDPDLKVVDLFYLECKQQGLEFPMAENESTAKAVIPATNRSGSDGQPFISTSPHQQQSASDRNTGIGNIRSLTAEQVAKLRSELDVVETNVQVFGEMLVTLIPGEEHIKDYQLLTVSSISILYNFCIIAFYLKDLYKTCTQMQARIIDLLSQIAIDEITVDLLRYNDELNNAFRNYASYMERREKVVDPESHSQQQINVPPSQTTSSPNRYPQTQQRQIPVKKLSTTSVSDDQPALIKFDDEPVSPSAQHSSPQFATGFQNMRLNQSPDAVPKPSNSTASHSSARQNNPIESAETQEPERDIKEIEVWLNKQDDKVTSSEEKPIA